MTIWGSSNCTEWFKFILYYSYASCQCGWRMAHKSFTAVTGSVYVLRMFQAVLLSLKTTWIQLSTCIVTWTLGFIHHLQYCLPGFEGSTKGWVAEGRLDGWLRVCPEPPMLQHTSSDAEGHLPAVREEITGWSFTSTNTTGRAARHRPPWATKPKILEKKGYRFQD